jgi:hypothetical protein
LFRRELLVLLAIPAIQETQVLLAMRAQHRREPHIRETHSATQIPKQYKHTILRQIQFTMPLQTQLELIPTTRVLVMPPIMFLQPLFRSMCQETLSIILVLITLSITRVPILVEPISLPITVKPLLRIIPRIRDQRTTLRELHQVITVVEPQVITPREQPLDTIRLLRIHIRTTSMRMETRSAISTLMPQDTTLCIMVMHLRRLQIQLGLTHKDTMPPIRVVPLEREMQATRALLVRQVQLVKLAPLLFSDRK